MESTAERATKGSLAGSTDTGSPTRRLETSATSRRRQPTVTVTSLDAVWLVGSNTRNFWSPGRPVIT